MTETSQTDNLSRHRLMTTAQVRELLGVTDMTIHRRLQRPDLKFPKPIYIGRRRYWREVELIAWLEACEVAE